MAVLINNKFKKVILTFPGTKKNEELLQEFLHSSGVVMEDGDNVKIMEYFNKSYKSVHKKLPDIFESLKNEIDSGYQFIFTGHSLGASLATILALDTVEDERIDKGNNQPVLITFGQPRTGNEMFANKVMEKISFIFRVVRQGDLITKIPLCTSAFYSSFCDSDLKDDKFDKNLETAKDFITSSEEIDYFFSWHIGGLKLFNNEMTSYQDCGIQYGENNPDSKCKINYSLDFLNHLIYFTKIDSLCRKE